MGPLIPFIKAPELPLSFLAHVPLIDRLVDPAHPPSIKPFGTLVALGVYIGSVVAVRHARQRGYDEKKMNDFIFWVVGLGFVGGHMLDAIFYHPAQLNRDPMYLFKLWDGLSSYGGFIGAAVGCFAWRWSRKLPILPYCDVVASAFPLAWVFGRAGCASVHDHPGRLSDAWYAVRWELADGRVVGRYDLGLYECLLTIPLAVLFAILWRRNPNRPIGFYVGSMCTAYAPVRFLLDFLREDEASSALGGDPRYGGLTPAQWACFGLLAFGAYTIWRAQQNAKEATETTGAIDPADAEPPSDPEPDSDPEPAAPARRRRER